MNEATIKEAFTKVKEDIFYLGSQLEQMKLEMIELKTEFKLISSFIEDLRLKNMQNIYADLHKSSTLSISEPILPPKVQQTYSQTDIPAQNLSVSPAIQHINQTQTTTPTDTPTVPCEIGGLIRPNMGISIGNGGVPTDKPTNQQTDQHKPASSLNSLDKAQEILASLDNLKKEVRFKFKRLTSQEMQVFSLLYNLEDSGIMVDYKILSEKLALSESSIRDYVGKIQKKGIPITKEKLNNKRILLHISPELKQIASLNTILKLREI